MKAIAIIPARLDSNRLPGKVLREIGGKPLIRWVWERVSRARLLSGVWITTDSPEIETACLKFTPHVHRSTQEHVCGTDRVAETARTLVADLFVNVQGDEPMMEPDLIDGVIGLFDDPDVKLASAATPIETIDQMLDANIVKCIQDLRGDALFFSRAPIPWPRDHPPKGRGPLPDGTFSFRHIGVYGYRSEDLQALAALGPTRLEQLESLEQLRAQEHGWKMRILVRPYSGIDIDTEEELEKFRQALVKAGEIEV